MEKEDFREPKRIKVGLYVKKKPSFRTIIGVCFIICLIILGFLIFKLMRENSECVGNPFIYGAQKTAEQGLEVTCSCIPLDPKYAGFNFDKNSLVIQQNFLDIGLSP